MKRCAKWQCPSCNKTRCEDYLSAENHLATCMPGPVYSSEKGQTKSISGKNLEILGVVLSDIKYKASYEYLVKTQWCNRKFVEPNNFEHAPLYKHGDDYVFSRSKLTSSRIIKPTVTSFTNTVFRLYQPKGSLRQLTEGQAAEKHMSNFWLNRARGALTNEDWRLIYKDHPNAESLRISKLEFMNQPIWGKPDIVFCNENTNELMIIERKVVNDHVLIPGDGWPNLRAQLWAYSLADKFSSFEKIHLVAEIWSKGQLLGRTKRMQPTTIKFTPSNLDLVWPNVFINLGGVLK